MMGPRLNVRVKSTRIRDDAYGVVGEDALLMYVSDELDTPNSDAAVFALLANLTCERNASQTIPPGGAREIDPPRQLVLDYGAAVPIPGQQQHWTTADHCVHTVR